MVAEHEVHYPQPDQRGRKPQLFLLISSHHIFTLETLIELQEAICIVSCVVHLNISVFA